MGGAIHRSARNPRTSRGARSWMWRNIWRQRRLSNRPFPLFVAAVTTVGVLAITGFRRSSSSSGHDQPKAAFTESNRPNSQKHLNITGDNSLYHVILRSVAKQSQERRPSTATDPSYITLKSRETVVEQTDELAAYGFKRFDLCATPRLNATPLDRFTTFFTPQPYSWFFLGLFESYKGSDTSHYLAATLPRTVAITLASLISLDQEGKTPPVPPSNASNLPKINGIDSKIVDLAIKRTFLITDNCVLYQGLDYANRTGVSKTSLVHPLGTALSGSSALLAMYDHPSRLLKVAITGNSRAVIGRPMMKDDGTLEYGVYPLTIEHIPSNPSEILRLNGILQADASFELENSIPRDASDSSHDSNENSIFNKLNRSLYDQSGQLFGSGVTRAFGLAAHKWSYELQQKIHRDYLGYNDILLPFHLPETTTAPSYPYLTPEPDITTVQIQPGDFLVMATSGLWRSLSNEEVVGLVGAWINRSEEVKRYIEKFEGVLLSEEEQKQRLAAEVPDTKGEGNTTSTPDPGSPTPATLPPASSEPLPVSLPIPPPRVFTFKDLPVAHLESSSLANSPSVLLPTRTSATQSQLDGHSILQSQEQSSTDLAQPNAGSSLYQQPLYLHHRLSIPYLFQDPLKAPLKPITTGPVPVQDKQFICIDNNVARHIIRNAIGGPDDDLVTAAINLDEYRAQKVRDSLNVMVIFF